MIEATNGNPFAAIGLEDIEHRLREHPLERPGHRGQVQTDARNQGAGKPVALPVGFQE
jgi:hypothetical protein